MKSIHPFEPFIPKGAKKLIIGSIPPPRFCKKDYSLYDKDVNFYYGSKDNAFWSILADLFDEKLAFRNTTEAINQRKKFLEKYGLGITDIVAECIHTNDSAIDNDLAEITRQDLGSLLAKHQSISTLIYTSEFVKKQINALLKTKHSIDKNNPKKQTIRIEDKIYQVKILYSPSPMARRYLGSGGDEKRKIQYREFLMKDE